MKKLLLHIYNETAGTAGAYIDQTLHGLDEFDCDVEALVNYWYGYKTKGAVPFFYKYSQKMPSSPLRRIVRYIELNKDCLATYKYIKRKKNNYDEIVVVFSLLACFKPIYKVIKRLSKTEGIKLGIVIHDAVPFEEKGIRSILMCKQDEIISNADFFVVHNDKTVHTIKKRYPDALFIKYRFPLMDVNQFVSKSNEKKERRKDYLFLSIGVIRKEKGIPVLLEAWKYAEENDIKAMLVIAGKNTSGEEFDLSGYSKVQYINEYLDDAEYCRLIESCDYVVLPYIGGTNSGILSTVSSMGKPCVTSDIPLFKEIPYVNDELMFESGNSEALGKLLVSLASASRDEYGKKVDFLTERTDNYRQLFFDEMKTEYRKIIGNEQDSSQKNII